MEVLELLLITRLLRAIWHPVKHGSLDTSCFQRFPQKFRFVPVHADSPQIAAIDSDSFQKRLESRGSAVGQVTPGDRRLHPVPSVCVVGRTGKQNGINVLLLLQSCRDFSGLLVKLRVAVDDLYIWNISLSYFFDDVSCDLRPGHANFHLIDPPFYN